MAETNIHLLDAAQFGTPSRDQFKFIESETMLDALFGDLCRIGMPKNSSRATKEELNSLAQWTKELAHPDNKETLQKYLQYDKNLFLYFRNLGQKEGGVAKEYHDLLADLFADLLPLAYKLKYHFQRPRPKQLAAYYKIKLFPFPSSVGDTTPAYPSLSVFVSRVVCEVLGNLQPKSYGFFTQLQADICYSRQYMGVAYPSDIDGGKICADKVLANPEFKLKYRL